MSDAGAPFDYGGVQGSDWPRQALRVISILTHQAWSLSVRDLIGKYRRQQRDGAYWGIATDLTKFAVPGALDVQPDVPERLANVRTRLNAFSEAEQCSLVNWGYRVRRLRAPLEGARRRAETRLAVPRIRPRSRTVGEREGRRLGEASGPGGHRVKGCGLTPLRSGVHGRQELPRVSKARRATRRSAAEKTVSHGCG